MNNETWESEIDLNDRGTTAQEDLEALVSDLRQELALPALEALVDSTSIADLLALAAQMTAN